MLEAGSNTKKEEGKQSSEGAQLQSQGTILKEKSLPGIPGI